MKNTFQIFLTLIEIFGIIKGSIDNVKNFKIEFNVPEKPKIRESSFKAAAESKVAKISTTFPDEMITTFEAHDKLFRLKLRKNDNLVLKDLKIDALNEDDVELMKGIAYNGISLEIKNKDNESYFIVKDPFARFFATSIDGVSINLQGGFEWEKVFFKLTNENHPNVKYHVSPHEIALLKRSDNSLQNLALESKLASSEIGGLVMLRESMNSKGPNIFNAGSNSTATFRCGHDDLNFNTDLRGVGNDFLSRTHDIKINPLTEQYYLSKRDVRENKVPIEDGCPINRKALSIGVAVDSAYLDKFDGNRQAAISNVITDFNLASAIYEESFNIELSISKIVILGKSEGRKVNDIVPWDLPCDSKYTIHHRLSALSKWRDSQSQDIVSGCSEGETVGIAWTNQVCTTKSFRNGNTKSEAVSGTSVSLLIPNQFSVIAHEIGHNFGAIHDCDSKECQSCRGRDCNCCTCGPCDCNGKYLMSPQSGGLSLRQFSPCTINEVCYKISEIGKCLKEPGQIKRIRESVCGNGILEDGEECDCGTEEECKGNPCCSFGCKLKTGAECSDDNEKCCNNCKIRKLEEKFECFKSKTKCQFGSTCDGKSAKCPQIKIAQNGVTCELDGGKCASGICTSRDIQCRKIGKRLGITKSCSKLKNSCKLVCESNEGQCVELDSNFIDGTACGSSGGTCTNGKCSTDSVFSAFMEDNSTLVIVMGAAVGSILLVLLLMALSRPTS